MKLLNHTRFTSVIAIFLLSISAVDVYSQKDNSDKKLLDEYIASKGYTSTIIFDATNIKQFWTDNTVMAKDGEIVVLLSDNNQKFESSSHKIQLTNVDNTLDCKIDVITNDSDLSFSISDKSSRMLSTTVTKSDFIQSLIFSSSFHLMDVAGYSFGLKFFSNQLNKVKIKKIVLSFSQNGLFLTSPGILQFGTDVIEMRNGIKKDTDDKNAFLFTGKAIRVFSKKAICISDNTLKASAIIKNTGDKATHVYLGYAPYTKDGVLINRSINLYNKQILKVLSHEKGSKKVVVDSYPEKWEKGCHLALNAKEDLSDFPNTNLVKWRIQEISKTSDGHTEIILDKELENAIEAGTLIRIQSPLGAAYMYPAHKILEPGEEITLTSSVQKDDTNYAFSTKSFCKGTDYVIPCILFDPVNASSENTVLIRDFSISY